MGKQIGNGGLQSAVAKHAILVAVFAYPLLTLTVRGGTNWTMAIIVVAAFYRLFLSGIKPKAFFADFESKLFTIAMLSGATSILFNQIYFQHFDFRPFDSELRFLLAVPVFFALREMRQQLAAVLEIAIPVGMLVTAVVLVDAPNQYVRMRNGFLDAIHVGQIAMVLGFLSLLSINWLRKDSRYMLLLKMVAFIASLYVVIRSGSRGVWLAMPLLILFGYWTQSWRPISIKNALMVVVGFCLITYFSIGIVQQRVDLTLANIESYFSGKVKDGTAVRIELWKVSLRLLKEHPLAGIEQDTLIEKMQQMHKEGGINALVLKEGMAEMHSEIAARMAKYGGLGLLSIFMTMAIPFWLFMRAMKVGGPVAGGAARMGGALMLALFVFGLTVEVFNIKMVAAFYALMIALLMALSIPARQDGASDSENE